MKSVVIFLAGASLSAHAATVSGVVKDSASAAPIAGIYVSLRTQTFTFARDTTDASGAYTLATDSTGAMIVRARDIGASANYTQKDTSVTLAASDAKTINLQLAKIPKTTVSGIVRADSAAGAPIAGAVVTLRSGGAMGRLDTTDADGKYQFDNVTMGNYFLSASAARFITNNLGDTIKLTTETPATKNIVLVPIVYSAVSGIIGTDAAPSAPIAGAIVSVRTPGFGGSFLRRDTTGADGKYQFDSLPTGSYILGITAEKYLPLVASDTIKLTSSAPATKNITLTAIVYAVISGIVGDDAATSAPIAGAVVTLRSASTMFGGLKDTTGSDGAYQFDNVESGTYIISASAAKYNPVSIGDTVKVTSAQPIAKKLTLKLIAYSSLLGTAVDGANAPLSKVVIVIRQTTAVGTITRRDTTSDDGKFAFDSILTGTYVVNAAIANYFPQSDTQELAATPLTLTIKLFPIVFAKITGTVTDSGGQIVAGALIMFTRSGTSATRTTTTNADGGYTLDSVTTGTISVIVGGIAKIVPITITSASAQTVNISYKATGSITRAQTAVVKCPMVGIGSNGCLRLTDFSGAGIVRMYDACGRQVLVRRLTSFKALEDFPLAGKISGGNYTVSVTRGASVIRSRIFVP